MSDRPERSKIARVEGPAIRAGWTARVLKAVDGLDAPDRARVLESIGDEQVASILERPRLSWLPMADHVAALQALVGVIGVAPARTLLRRAALNNLRGTLLAGPVAATLRVFGVGPLAIVRMFPRGFKMITRDAGRVAAHARDDGTTIAFDDLPPVQRCEAWATSVCALFEAFFDLAGLTGTVDLDTTNIGTGSIAVTMRADDRDTLVHEPDDR